MGNLQTNTLAFEVQGALDGVTEAPAFSPDSHSANYKQPSSVDQIYPVLVEGNLGLIDPDYRASDASMGDRFLQRLEIQSPVVGDAGAFVALVDARGIVADIIELERIDDLTGLSLYYRDTCVYIPQGMMLQISGFADDPAGGSHLVRLHVVGAETAEGEALLNNACCCEETDETDPSTVCDLLISTVDPDLIPGGTGEVLVTLTGEGFVDSDLVTVLPQTGPPTDIFVAGSWNANAGGTSATFLVDTDIAGGGTYDVVVTHADDETCSATDTLVVQLA